MITALERSANTFFYQIANQMGINQMHQYIRLFGFGKKTQIKMPLESQGLLPHPSWKGKNLQ